MDFVANNLDDNIGRVISTFNVGDIEENINMTQDEFSFTDGFTEGMKNNNIEEIQMLKDEVVIENEVKKKPRTNKKRNIKTEDIKNKTIKNSKAEDNTEKTINNKGNNKKTIAEELLNNRAIEENEINKNFKDYIKLCNSMGLIPSWTGFDKYKKL